MAAPCAVVASCCVTFSPDQLIKDILCTEILPEGSRVLEDIVAYPWHLDTKYYSADVLLCSCDSRTIGDQTFAESVEAFLLYFNPQETSSFEQVESWQPYLEELDPEIKLLVCDQATDSQAVSRKQTLAWCIKHGFELIELSPEEEENSDVEDDFQDSYGVERIVQALRAHTWSNLVLKEKPEIHSIYFKQMLEEAKSDQTCDDVTERLSATDISSEQPPTDTADTSCEHTPSVLQQNTEAATSNEHSPTATNCDNDNNSAVPVNPSNMDNLLGGLLGTGDQSLLDALESEDPDDDSFEKLFSKLHKMKGNAEKLPWDQRKSYAEQVTKLFWRSMGGAEDEIANLSDSD